MKRIFTLYFIISCINLFGAAPNITSVTIPQGNYKIGDNIVATIASDGTGYTLDPSTINGILVTGFTDLGDNNYTVTYTVASGNTDRTSVGAIPINITLRNGGGPGTTTTYTAPPTSSGTVTIDAHAPVVSSVTSDATSTGVLKIGQTITFTVDIQTSETGLTIAPTTYNGRTLTWSTSNSGDTYTATYTVTSGDPDQTSVLQLTGVTATDAAGNTTNPSVSGTDVAKTIDANAPSSSGTVGAIAPLGGRVVSLYLNSTNTQIKVTVPIPNDASLDDGSVQLKIRMTGGSFTNVPGSGLSTITNTERTNGTKDITVNVADLATAGMTDGNSGGLRSSETKFLQVTATLTDLAGNTSSNLTTSATELDVDTTIPTITGGPILVQNTGTSPGGGNHEVIEFYTSEPLSDHVSAPAERTNNFPFINSQNNYGNPGISVGGNTSGAAAGATDLVKYIYQGGTNSIVSSFTNVHLVYVESQDNTSNWSVGNGTKIQYVRGGSSDVSAYVMRDPAGNELANQTIVCSGGAQTNLSSATAISGTDLINGSNAQAVFAFSLTPTTTNPTLSALSIISSADPNGLLGNFRLYKNSVNSFATATNTGATASVTASAPYAVNFSGLSISLTSSTTTYFFLMADVPNYFPSLNPTIQFSMAASSLPNAGGGFTVSSGGYGGTDQSGTTFTLRDYTYPTVTSIDISSPTEPWSGVNGTFASTLTWRVVFSEPVTGVDVTDFALNRSTGSDLSFDPLTVSGSGNDTITVTVDNVQLLSVSSTAQLFVNLTDNNSIADAAGNVLSGSPTSNTDGSLTSVIAYPGSSSPGYNDYYTVLFPEPSNAPTNFSADSTVHSVQISWNDPVSPTVPANYYLVQLKKQSVATFTDPVDGYHPFDYDLSDGTLSLLYLSANIRPLDIENYTGVSLPSGTTFDIRIISASYSGYYNWNSTDYLFDFQFDFLTNPADILTGTVTTAVSADSRLTDDPTFTYSQDADYINRQAANIDAVSSPGTSYEITRFLVQDGDPSNISIIGATDEDDTPTILQDFEVELYTGASLLPVKRIAIYVDGIEKAEATPSSLVSGKSTTSFTGINVTANDESTRAVSIWVSFDNNAANILDNDTIMVRISSATAGNGSQFVPGSGYIGGVDGGFQTPATANHIEVTATRLDFTSQPPSVIGRDQPFTPPVIEARDINGIVDRDYDSNNSNTAYQSASISAPAGLSLSTFDFTNGKLVFSTIAPGSPFDSNSLYYSDKYIDGSSNGSLGHGDGTLVVTANGLSSNAGGSTPCNHVDVVHVTADLIPPGTGGVLGSNNIKGGTTGAVIFGVTFTPQYALSTEPSLNEFTFSFDSPYKVTTGTGMTIFKNFKVYESTAGSYSSSIDVTSLTGTVTQLESATGTGDYDLVKVTFSTPRTLYNATRSYFLVADVDATANISTPPLTPQLIELGYRYGDQNVNNDHIKTTIGSSHANVALAVPYRFASTRPPQLLSSYPYNGQLNVDPNLATIQLHFDVKVLTFDGTAALYSKTTNAKLADLTATNGNYGGDPTTLTDDVVDPLYFAIPSGLLQPDSLYYITIAKGSFSPTTNTGTGISDDGLNFYGGISYNSTLYFKVASPNPPNLLSAAQTFASNSAATFNVEFDQRGTGYYLVLDHDLYVSNGASPPDESNYEISNPSFYPYPTVIVAGGSFDITNISQSGSNPQGVAFGANLQPGKTYDVWIFAENDALPSPVRAVGPYRNQASNFVADPSSNVPTLQIVVPSTITSNNNEPYIRLCPNSTTIISEPIVLGESSAGDLDSSGIQNFNLVLPNGFSFDVTHTPTVTVTGGDFYYGGLDTVIFVNNTILNISFENYGTSFFDNIIITGLKIITGPAGGSGQIVRFAGSTSQNFLLDNQSVATLVSNTPLPQVFTNSYTQQNINYFNSVFSLPLTQVLTVIPDNFVDPQQNNASTVKLVPVITPSTDYGPSTFNSTGGVTNDVLNLSGVALNTAFDITMTHTDLNGCVSKKVDQYMVYDHTKALPKFITSAQYGTKQSLVNPNFPSAAPPLLSAGTLFYNDIAGYSLKKLVANIPSKITSGSQIIYGPDWQNIVAQVPVLQGTPAPFNSYKWDFAPILNAKTLSGGAIALDPYDNFKAFAPNGLPYWKGGSLGIIEFLGHFQSTPDSEVQAVIGQGTELYVPPIPIIDFALPSSFDGNDPLNPVSASVLNGTPVYCEQGGDILLTGYPAALAGTSTGQFTLFDAATGTSIPFGTGFIDNGNGTAVLKPGRLSNSYQDIKVVYTFKENVSPISGSSPLIIRITPNPTPNFTTSTLCEDIDVTFTDASTVPGTGFSISRWTWNFGDLSSPNNTSTLQNPTHIYSNSGLFTPVTLDVETTFGCKSVAPKSVSLQVGGTPAVDFNFTGVYSTSTNPITFVSNSSVSGNDKFKTLDWTFGDGNIAQGNYTNQPSNPTEVFSNHYATAGVYNVNLTVTSEIGCIANKTKLIVILPFNQPTSTNAYDQDFEFSDGGWQTLPTSATTPASSWAYGIPDKTVTQSVDLNKRIAGSQLQGPGNVWATSLTGTYHPLERSYLYSPVFDLSGLARPMVSFNSFVQFPNKAAGVVLQYSTDNKNVADPTKRWNVLGFPGSGVDWYNGINIVSKPGEQVTNDFGWDDSNSTDWLESKHQLGVVSGNAKVVFRFALATSETSVLATSEGFALDNFRVGERTRTVLLESFANTSNTNSNEKIENEYINNFATNVVGTDIVKINYHTGFPGIDPFNQDNPADPGARALFYGVSSTPSSRIDGQDDAHNRLFDKWGQSFLDNRTLQLAQADITIIPQIKTTGEISFYVKVDAITDLAPNTILHAVILEQSIAESVFSAGTIKSGETHFEYVLKKMLPSGAGTMFGSALMHGQSRLFGPFEWTPDSKKLYPAPNDLAIAAFLQNETTKEVLQSEIIRNIEDPPVVTGLGDLNVNEITVYPNPANSKFTIELPAPSQRAIPMQVVDQMGRVIHLDNFNELQRTKTVDAESFAEGLYIIQLGEGATSVRKKVVITHK